MESLSTTLQALVLLVIALGLIIGTVIVNPVYTVMLAVTLVVVNGVILVALTMRPSGS
ncbi:MAG TPA: sugar tyrosine-protein kinase [Azospirillaceae bacterium]|nr:sugar tyrosine-protein kinase [Azospirillaceae bacterium]HRQ82778.1 sugar tyrosine-protein kinase [Azospirillaceae bacterium]